MHEAAAAENLAAAIRAAYVDDYNESVRLHLEKAESLRRASAEKHEAIAAAAEQDGCGHPGCLRR